jgi:TetR/AcrR family transcriptional regulator, transcriptional repressor for nem operon
MMRNQIIEAADRLFYQQGYDHTSFAHIAEAVGISRGNFYFHFKSKDEILAAVIERRIEATARVLEAWETEPTPAERLNRQMISRFGCPVGTLCSELSKVSHPAHGHAARLFTLFREWLRRQFEAAGLGSDADDLAMNLLTRSQGIAVLAAAFHDEAYLRQEVKRLAQWLKCVLAGDASEMRANRGKSSRRNERQKLQFL